MNAKIQKHIQSALEKGLLFYRVTDQYGRSCNGGDRNFRLDPAVASKPGKWSLEIKAVRICSVGYHATTDPLAWQGYRVSLVEVDEVVEKSGNKIVCHKMRELTIVYPWECIDQRIWSAVNRPYLIRANLSDANLRGANLSDANLSDANLSDADLIRADLRGADTKNAIKD